MKLLATTLIVIGLFGFVKTNLFTFMIIGLVLFLFARQKDVA